MANFNNDINKSNHPLVSFCLFAYNQEKYIREAVEGALNQTYIPLEIILSDDFSTDNTFQIIKEMCINYKGPHTLILNRNKQNMGIGGHYSKIIEMSHGEFILSAAGDDISHSQRAEIMVREWEKSNYKKHVLFHSGRRSINSLSDILNEVYEPKYSEIVNYPELLIKNGAYATGCTIGYPKTLYEFYGPLHDGILNEDAALTFRASLLDGVILIKELLVDYRVGIGIGSLNNIKLSKDEKINFKYKHTEYLLHLFEQYLKDFKRSGNKSKKIEIMIIQDLNNKKALMYGIENNLFKVIKKLFFFIHEKVSLKIILFIILFNIFKSFGVNRIPNILLR